MRRAYDLARSDPIAAIAVVVLALGAAQLLAGALATGVTIDEPIEADSTRSWIDHGWYLPNYLLVDGDPDPGSELASPYVYGPAFGLLAHSANVLVGEEAIGEISRSAGAYAMRHLVSALLAALAVAAVGAATWLLTGSRRFGLWAAAALLAIPEWSGQAFFNPKDIPAACGYTLVTVALAFAFASDPGEPASRRRKWAIAALLGGGFFIGAGTRLALIVPLLISVLAYAGLRLGQRRLGGLVRDPGADFAVAAGTGIGLGAIAVAYPKVASSPLTMLTESVSGSSGYPWQGVTLTAGQLLSEHPPWWYLPTWIGAALPLLLGALALLGAVAGVRTLIAARGADWRGPIWTATELPLALVLLQALMLPLGAIVTGAVMYSGMRQHLYVLPALAILAGFGASRLWQWARTHRPTDRRPAFATALLGLALLFPLAEQAMLFPYAYTYVNPVARIGGVDDRWETDYWVAAAPEALSHIPGGVEPHCFLVFPTVGCEEDQLAPFADRQGTDVAERWREDRLAAWAIVRRHAGNQPPDYCERADDVDRQLPGATVTMVYVLRCDPELLASATRP